MRCSLLTECDTAHVTGLAWFHTKDKKVEHPIIHLSYPRTRPVLLSTLADRAADTTSASK